jgi:hypothetical protein
VLSRRTALFALSLVACPLSAQSVPASLTPTEVREWQQDLDFLAREMPKLHANLFHSMTHAQFDSAISAIRAKLPRLQRHQVIGELERLDALVGDGHSNVSPWRDTVIGFHTLPVALYRFSDGYYVRATTREHAELIGARVVRIGHIGIDSAAALVAPLIGHDNSMGLLQWTPVLLEMPEVLNAVGLSRSPRRADLTLEINGTARKVSLDQAGPFPNQSGDADRSWDPLPGWSDARELAPTPLWLSHTADTYWFTYVPASKLLYCQINEIQERGEKLDTFMKRALATADSAGAQKFVLDLRLNGGGNGDYNTTIVRALVKSRFDERGKLFVITGRRTFSAAQMLISDLEKWSNPIFVGEPSESRGNHFGDSKRIVLPNSKVSVRVSSLYWQYWDPRDTRPWIDVQLETPLSFADYAAGRDPALEAIASYRAVAGRTINNPINSSNPLLPGPKVSPRPSAPPLSPSECAGDSRLHPTLCSADRRSRRPILPRHDAPEDSAGRLHHWTRASSASDPR